MNNIFGNKVTRLVLVLVLVSGAIFVIWRISYSGFSAKNPNDSEILDPTDGQDEAVLYNYDELYEIIEQTDSVLNIFKEDLHKFARTTIPTLSDPSSKVAFTFMDGHEKEGEAYLFRGKYYDFDDEILLKVTPEGRGVYTLSISNTVDNTNIDSSLSLNGKRNELIKSLPLQKNRYSVRYLLPKDQIVVSFYEGYTVADVNEVEKLLIDSLGSNYEEDVIFSINTKGTFTLDEVRKQAN